MAATYLRCVVCGDVAASAPDDGPWAPSLAVEGGVLCSPLCALREEFARYDGPNDGPQRADAMRRGLLEDPAVVEAVRLTVVHVSDVAPVFRGVLEGPVLEVDADGVTVEHGPDGDPLNVPWRSVVDAAEVA